MICRLCPRECGAQRTEQRGSGFCGMPVGIRVARAALHRWEEPPISGTNGSGAVFFSGCTLRCCYCQNHAISAEGFGKDVTPQRLRAIFEELIAQGAHNIDLITATHFLPCRRWSRSSPCRWCITAAGMKRWRRCGGWRDWWTSGCRI